MTYKTILPANSTPLEYDLENVMAPAYDLSVENILKLWRPDECPVEFLPWLAWAFSVDVWDPRWIEGIKRDIVKESLKIHRHKGTRWAIKRILELAGNPDIGILEWFEQVPHAEAHTFLLTLNSTVGIGQPLSLPQYNRIQRLVDSVKPARSHYKIRINTKFGNAKEPIFDADTGKISGSCLVLGQYGLQVNISRSDGKAKARNYFDFGKIKKPDIDADTGKTILNSGSCFSTSIAGSLLNSIKLDSCPKAENDFKFQKQLGMFVAGAGYDFKKVESSAKVKNAFNFPRMLEMAEAASSLTVTKIDSEVKVNNKNNFKTNIGITTNNNAIMLIKIDAKGFLNE